MEIYRERKLTKSIHSKNEYTTIKYN